MEQDNIKKIVMFCILALLLVVAFLLVRPFITAILTALVLAYVFHPLQKKLSKKINPSLSAIIFCLVILVIVIFPIIFFAPTISRQIFEFQTYVGTTDVAGPLVKAFPKFFATESSIRQITLALNQMISKAISTFMERFTSILIHAPEFFLQFMIMIFTFFFSLRDSDKIIYNLKRISPFKPPVEKRLTHKFNDTTKAVIFGMFIVGLVQGIVTGIGFYLFRAPQPFLLTILAIFFGILPIVGSWIVWVPVAIGMLVNGNMLGIGLVLYGICFITWIDPLLRPRIVTRRTGMSHILALIGMLGGLLLFGVIGFIIGPLVLGYLRLFFEFYRTKTLHKL